MKKILNGETVEMTAAEISAFQAQQAIDSIAPPAPPDPNAELRAAIAAATTLDELKAALLGAAPGATAAVAGKAKAA